MVGNRRRVGELQQALDYLEHGKTPEGMLARIFRAGAQVGSNIVTVAISEVMDLIKAFLAGPISLATRAATLFAITSLLRRIGPSAQDTADFLEPIVQPVLDFFDEEIKNNTFALSGFIKDVLWILARWMIRRFPFE